MSDHQPPYLSASTRYAGISAGVEAIAKVAEEVTDDPELKADVSAEIFCASARAFLQRPAIQVVSD
jgi:hypothetical protein